MRETVKFINHVGISYKKERKISKKYTLRDKTKLK